MSRRCSSKVPRVRRAARCARAHEGLATSNCRWCQHWQLWAPMLAVALQLMPLAATCSRARGQFEGAAIDDLDPDGDSGVAGTSAGRASFVRVADFLTRAPRGEGNMSEFSSPRLANGAVLWSASDSAGVDGEASPRPRWPRSLAACVLSRPRPLWRSPLAPARVRPTAGRACRSVLRPPSHDGRAAHVVRDRVHVSMCPQVPLPHDRDRVLLSQQRAPRVNARARATWVGVSASVCNIRQLCTRV